MTTHEKSILVNAPVHRVFLMWRNFENFPKFMSHVEEVRMLDGGTSHWRGRLDGIDEEWDAKTTRMDEDKAIAWESVSGFQNRGEIRFDPVDHGTKITVHFEYEPPAGIFGDTAEALYVGRKFDESLEEDLRNFKQKAENP